MEQFRYGNIEQTSRKARLKAEAVRLAMETMPKYVIRVDSTETHGVNLVGEHGWKVTPEDMTIPHSELNYE